MKTTLIILFVLSAGCCFSQEMVLTNKLQPETLARYSIYQKFILNEAGKWIKQGKPFKLVDTLTQGHAYKWRREKIVAVQDLKKINGKWVKYGNEYVVPDTLKEINLLVHR